MAHRKSNYVCAKPRPPQIHTHHSVFCNENKTKMKKRKTAKKLESVDSWLFQCALLNSPNTLFRIGFFFFFFWTPGTVEAHGWETKCCGFVRMC